MSTDNIEIIDELGLSDRGIGVQAAGFAITGCISIAILHLYSGSDHVLYQWFETAVKDIYWAFLFPLAALLDWGRKMFAKGKAIREAKKAEILAKAKQEGVKQTVQRSNANLRAWAKERGIPEEDLPFLDEDA